MGPSNLVKQSVQPTRPPHVKSISVASRKPTQPSVVRETLTHLTVGTDLGSGIEICLPTSSNEKDRMEALESRQSKTPREKKLVRTKNINAFKSTTGNKATAFLKASKKLSKKGNESALSNNTQLTQLRVGNMVQEQGNSNTQ